MINIIEERQQRGINKRENYWTTEHTHKVETHQHKLCSLIPRQLKSGSDHGCRSTADWVNESLTDRRKTAITHDLIGKAVQDTDQLPDSNGIRKLKKMIEKTQPAFMIPAH